MAAFKTHLTVLEASSVKHATRPALKIPVRSQHDSESQGWESVTVSQFRLDVENSARYWADQLFQRDIRERSVVGMWLKGASYLDLVHIWGVCRAGFIPVLISLRMTSPAVVYELFGKADAKALIYEPTFQKQLDRSPLPAVPAVDILQLKVRHLTLPPLWTPSTAQDVVFIFHTSGSTSGNPKLVPVTAKWIDGNIYKFKGLIAGSQPSEIQETLVAGGSFCHFAGTACLIAFIDRGGCLVLPTEFPFGSAEVHRMVKHCGLTALFMFSAFLRSLIHEARSDPSLLATLRSLEFVTYGGLSLDPLEEGWARSQGVNLTNVFASTEVGIMLQSSGGQGKDAAFLQPYAGTIYSFVPVSKTSESEFDTKNEELLELVVSYKSPDCPHPSLRSTESSGYHTGDLFVERKPGQYLSKGRNDDWIKMENAMRCDTGSIEKNAMETCCKDLISVAVVVGTGRPSPVLVVEPKDAIEVKSEGSVSRLKHDILSRIAPFHERRYVHERILDPSCILIRPCNTLPRTAAKGNIKRKAVEADLSKELDQVFSTTRETNAQVVVVA